MNPLQRIFSRSFSPVRFKKSRSGMEVNFPCPKCGHSDFHFNLEKRKGFCFRARCHWAPSLQNLKPYFKGSLSSLDESLEDTRSEDPTPLKISLPGEVLVWKNKGQFHTRNRKAMEEVLKRGVSVIDQYVFGLTVTEDRVYIPVYEKGQLVNYVGRLFWWVPFASPMRYTYATGVRTSDYLFNWDSASKWSELSLVENSFNGIWLHKFCCTTNFGSSLSEMQIENITKGKAESVVLLWDEGADISAERAVKKLQDNGLSCAYIKIKGQPDDHSEEFIKNLIHEGHKLAKTGNKIFLDAR